MIINASEARELSFKSPLGALMEKELVPNIMKDIESAAKEGRLLITFNFNADAMFGVKNAYLAEKLIVSYLGVRGYTVALSKNYYDESECMLTVSWDS